MERRKKEPCDYKAPEICLGIKEYEINASGKNKINTMRITVYVNIEKGGLNAYEEILNRINQFVIG